MNIFNNTQLITYRQAKQMLSKTSTAVKHTLLHNARNMQARHAHQAQTNDHGGSVVPKASIKKQKRSNATMPNTHLGKQNSRRKHTKQALKTAYATQTCKRGTSTTKNDAQMHNKHLAKTRKRVSKVQNKHIAKTNAILKRKTRI